MGRCSAKPFDYTAPHKKGILVPFVPAKGTARRGMSGKVMHSDAPEVKRKNLIVIIAQAVQCSLLEKEYRKQKWNNFTYF